MFRFTIRDVLWLTVVVALAVAWLRDYRLAAGFESITSKKGYKVSKRRWNSWPKKPLRSTA
jgi:hypothetical protein